MILVTFFSFNIFTNFIFFFFDTSIKGQVCQNKFFFDVRGDHGLPLTFYNFVCYYRGIKNVTNFEFEIT